MPKLTRPGPAEAEVKLAIRHITFSRGTLQQHTVRSGLASAFPSNSFPKGGQASKASSDKGCATHARPPKPRAKATNRNCKLQSRPVASSKADRRLQTCLSRPSAFARRHLMGWCVAASHAWGRRLGRVASTAHCTCVVFGAVHGGLGGRGLHVHVHVHVQRGRRRKHRSDLLSTAVKASLAGKDATNI